MASAFLLFHFYVHPSHFKDILGTCALPLWAFSSKEITRVNLNCPQPLLWEGVKDKDIVGNLDIIGNV